MAPTIFTPRPPGHYSSDMNWPIDIHGPYTPNFADPTPAWRDDIDKRDVAPLSFYSRIFKRQQTVGIIPTAYPNNGTNAGTVAGITLGVVAGVILLCVLFYFLSNGRGGGANAGTIVGTEDIVVRDRGRQSPERAIVRDRERERRKRRTSHRSQRSEREMREISRSPARRPSRTIVEERVERISRDRGSIPPPPIRSNIEIVTDRRSSRGPPIVSPPRRVDGDDIVEVIEEGSVSTEPPRRERRNRKSSGGYRQVDPPIPSVARQISKTTVRTTTVRRKP